MKLKRIAAAFTAAVCFAGVFSGVPFDTASNVQAAVINNFEISFDGWCAYGETMLAPVFDGVDGTRALRATDRKSGADGVASAKGFYLDGGIKYSYSAKVRAEDDDRFYLTLRWLDPETGEYGSKVIAEKNIKAGEWGELKTAFAAPEGTINLTLIITSDKAVDFSIDDVKATENGFGNVYAASSDKGLKDEFADYFKVGTAVPANLMTNSKATAILLKDFNSVTCENELKPDSTLAKWKTTGDSAIGVNIGEGAASIMEFCEKNHISMRGHTMVWYSQTPEWFFKKNFDANSDWVSKSVMEKRLESYIKNMFAEIKRQYPNLDLYCYDICNECISDNVNNTKNATYNEQTNEFNFGGGRDAGYGSGASPWVRVYGNNSFMESAYTYARQYAPKGCKLYYNDYNEYWDHKMECIRKTCTYLYKKGLLDGVGMQSHIAADPEDGFTGLNAYKLAMKTYANIGCDVQITELDIDIKTKNNSGQTVNYTDEQQAQKYKAIFEAAMDLSKRRGYFSGVSGKLTALCVWGIDDAHSWVNMNDDNGSNPLLYTSSFRPKTAYNYIASIIPESQWGGGSGAAEPNEYGWYFDSAFESDTEGWVKRGSSTLELSSDEHYVGGKSLYVSGRTATWNGASKELDTATYAPGTAFSFSANVKYNDGAATEPFYLKLQYEGSDGKTHYDTIAQSTALKGEWVQLVNKSYVIPEGASDLQLYVETGNTYCDFYMDEVIVAVDGTSINGAGARTILLGDLTMDGSVDSADYAMMLLCLKAGTFGDDAVKLAADVDRNGKQESEDAEYIKQFVLGSITEFPKAEAVVDTAEMEAIFAKVTAGNAFKNSTNNNPLYTQRFGADPGVMEYNGRIYVYMTNDVFEYDSNGNIKKNDFATINKINIISSDDMVNWTDHGCYTIAGSDGAAKWASLSWAPCAAHKAIGGKEKFFMYFCNGGNGIGVVSSDSPTGPWTDELGQALVTRSTPNCSTVTWLFDPAVMVDSDGTGYLCFGGGVPEGKESNPGTARIVKLGDNMMSLSGNPQTLDPPYLFEDSGINKIGNKYYYTYCSHFNTSGNSYDMGDGCIQYMVSDSPMGTYTYGGQLLGGTYAIDGKGGNNHHSIAELNGKLYIFYHTCLTESMYNITGDGGYRCPMVNEISKNGTSLNQANATVAGVSQIKNIDPYSRVQAETISRESGITVNGNDNTTVSANKGDWIGVKGVKFSNGASNLTVRARSSGGAAIKVCYGSENGSVIGYVNVPAGNSYSEITVPVNNVSGTKDVYFVFSGDTELDYWYFS